MTKGEDKVAKGAIPRWRSVAAVGVATVVPAWTLLIGLAAGSSLLVSRRAVAAALTGAFVACAVRGIGALARWLVLGQGPLFDRLLWGVSFATYIALAAAWQFRFGGALAAYLAYFVVLVVIWSVSAAAFSLRPRGRKTTPFKLSLGDLLTALAAFGVLAGSIRFLLAGLRRGEAYDLPYVFVASALGSVVVAAVALFVDAGVRFLAIGADATDARMLVAIGCFFVLVSVAMGLATALVVGDPVLAGFSGFAATYLTFAAAQEEFLARTIET